MATVNRPPFWVPRGDQQDTVWYAQPLKSPIIPFLTKQKIFGAGGQVPTKRWSQQLTYDDPPMWQGPLMEWMNSGAITTTRTQVKFFGQPGQAPTKKWIPYLLYDDPPMWQGAPLNSGAIMATKTQVKVYGQPGQAPTKAWARWLTYDDPPTWWPTATDATASLLLYTAKNPFSNRQWQWSDDASYWSGEPVSSAPILLLTAKQFFGQGGQVPPFRPNFTIDDPPQWQGTPRAAVSLNVPGIRFYGQIGQVPPFRPNFTYDDASYWSGEPINSAAIQLLTPQRIFGQGGQVPPFRWNYTYDDPGFWAGEPINSAAIQLLTPQKVFGQGGQAPPYRWNYTLDDPPSWQPWIQTNLALSAQAVVLPMAAFFAPRPADETYWSGNPLNSVTIRITPPRSPFVNYKTWWYAEDSFWQGEPVNSAAIQLLTAQKVFGQGGQVPPYRWNYAYDDPPSWQWPLYERNPNVLQPSAEPFNNYKTYWYSEDSFWQGSPLNSGAINATKTQVTIYGQPGQAPPFRPNFTLDDPPTWQWAMGERNRNVLTPSTQVFSNRVWQWSDDAPGWQGSPTWSATITLSGFHLYSPRSSLYFWRTYLDDWSTWQWPLYERNQNVLQPSGEPFNSYKTYWYSEDSFWQGSPLNSGAINATKTQVTIYGQPGQAPPFRPNFTLDDASSWQWPLYERNPNVLQPSAEPFHSYKNWQTFWYDEGAVWSWSPPPPILITSSFVSFAPFNSWAQWALRLELDSFWVGTPVNSRAINLTTTQVKFFGQPGQVPTKRWLPYLLYDDPPMWQGSPLDSGAIQVTKTQVKVFGQPGQAPTKPWVAYLLRDDAPMWQGTPITFNYLLTQPGPPVRPSGNDWIDFRRRARRR